MRHILLILFIGFIVFSSCDGRITKNESLKQSVLKFKDEVKPAEIIEFYPSDYSEVKTDTILNNGYKVKIKNFTDMSSSILNEFTSNKTNYKHFFRQIISEVLVFKNDKLIFNSTIDERFLQNHTSDIISLDNYVNQGFILDQFKSLKSNQLILISCFIEPKTNNETIIQIAIDEKGKFNFKTLNYAGA